MTPTPVRQKAVAARRAFTQSGEGKGLATAPIAATSHRAVTATLKPRSPATRNGCTQRIGTKVKHDEERDDGERDKGMRHEGEEIEADDVPDGGEADEIAFLGLAVLIGHMEQARHHHGDAGGKPVRLGQEIRLAQGEGGDRGVGQEIDDQSRAARRSSAAARA